MSGIAARIGFLLLKLFMMVIVTFMILFQLPELRYDFGPKTPASIEAADLLTTEPDPGSTFAAVHGTIDFDHAAVFARHGVRFTYFLLDGCGEKLVVRTPEQVTEEWKHVDRHVGRLKPFSRMPFRRSIRAGFRQQFDVGIPENAYFLARDDVPKTSGWSVGALIFALLLWCILFFFFFLWKKPPSPYARMAADTVTESSRTKAGEGS